MCKTRFKLTFTENQIILLKSKEVENAGGITTGYKRNQNLHFFYSSRILNVEQLRNSENKAAN